MFRQVPRLSTSFIVMLEIFLNKKKCEIHAEHSIKQKVKLILCTSMADSLLCVTSSSCSFNNTSPNLVHIMISHFPFNIRY